MERSLTEPKIKFFISNALKECRQFKERHINLFFNIFMFLLFVIFISGFLIYKYKGKLTNKEMIIRNNQKKEYIISKLRKMSLDKNKQSENIITDLPIFDRY